MTDANVEAMNAEERATVHGKQLKLDGHHLADCVSDAAALVLAIALNNVGCDILEDWERDKVESYLA